MMENSLNRERVNNMKQKIYRFTVMGLGVFFLLCVNCISAFGQSSNDGLTSVNIIQSTAGTQVKPLLVDVKPANLSQVITNQVELEFEEEYESPYIEVKDYRNIAFYVLLEQSFSLPSPRILYQLDAFFSLRPVDRTLLKIGLNNPSSEATGWQEFGSVIVKPQTEKGESSFTRLTTGVTVSRVLYTSVYGPYVRVVLKNLTSNKTCKFKIVAYLTR